jgi:hypothetical protein
MKKIIFTVFSILIILTTIFFIAIGTVRDSRYYILLCTKLFCHLQIEAKKSKQYFSTLELNFFV